ncbi:endonuclease/exonuclease/phosphatase family protein [Streptomyces sp. MP131-18]|uniref:endonuclease/exonuclease/phosphatase family protein n=1 Tax=Streptomyces sp. MP131-18 TaxID=1857892 RepID=UPI0009A24F26|nr:endonuclease/exonuclease/phosphatase family protein [Streptomyces sp. MP131-18]
MNQHIRIATCNFELNGNDDVELRARLHHRLRDLKLDLLMRQEMIGFGVSGRDSQAWLDSQTALGMKGELGPGMGATALYWAPKVFTPRRNWANEVGTRWEMPPTTLSLELTGTTIPIVCCSHHHVYDNPVRRESEANWLTRLNDKTVTLKKRRIVLPCIVGGDTNSYPEPGTPGDVPLPRLDVPDSHPLAIRNEPHRNHRSRLIIPGQPRVLDIWPDNNLREAGLEDAARHLATVPDRETDRARILAPTVDAYPTHGPATRIDRIYLSRKLLPAVADVEVINMREYSDHHTVVVSLDRAVLISILADLAVAA